MITSPSEAVVVLLFLDQQGRSTENQGVPPGSDKTLPCHGRPPAARSGAANLNPQIPPQHL